MSRDGGEQQIQSSDSQQQQQQQQQADRYRDTTSTLRLVILYTEAHTWLCSLMAIYFYIFVYYLDLAILFLYCLIPYVWSLVFLGG